MSRVTVGFIKSALIYLGLAVLIGMHLAAGGPDYPFRAVHAHLNLIGWMNMMIFGVAYHILPRFSGAPLWSEKLSVWHLWLANISFIGMLVGWGFMFVDPSNNKILITFAALHGISIFMFIVNIFKTLAGRQGQSIGLPCK